MLFWNALFQRKERLVLALNNYIVQFSTLSCVFVHCLTYLWVSAKLCSVQLFNLWKLFPLLLSFQLSALICWDMAFAFFENICNIKEY